MPSSAQSIERYIDHPVFGEGEVVDSRLHGLQLRVRFANGLSLWVSSHGLRVYERSREEIDQIAARRMTEAFRLGVVPHQDVERFTFGRQGETEMVEQALAALAKGSGGAYVIEGEYGAGKSHLLELIRHRAAEAGFVTAWCNLDPREVSPHRPKRVYRELVHSMRYFDHEAELSFREILRQGVGLELDDHVFLSPVLKRLERYERTGVAAEVFWQWIEGESTKEYAAQPGRPYRLPGAQKIPALYDFSTAGDFYSYILSGLSYMMHRLGMKGLVLLIDEAEAVTHLWNSRAVDRGINFLEGLIRSAENDPRLKTIDERMVHNRVRTTPYIYKDSYITLFLATTPLVGEYSYVRMTSHARKRIALNPLREADLHELFVRLCFIYRQAYPQFELSADWEERLLVAALKRKEEGIRFFIKYWVEGLDWLRWSK